MNTQATKPESRLWQHAEFILPLMLLALHGAFYNTIGDLASLRGVDFGPWLATPLDRLIPFSALFIIPYTAIWLLPIYMVVRLKRQDGFTVQQMRRVSGAFVALILVCYALWIAFPMQMNVRAAEGLLVDGGLLGQFTQFTYQNATPWNACPSFHVAAPWLICRILSLYTGKVPVPIACLTAAIFLATVGIRIHYLLDIVGGILVAETVHRVVLLRLEQAKSLALVPSRVMVAAYCSLGVGALAIFVAIQAVL